MSSEYAHRCYTDLSVLRGFTGLTLEYLHWKFVNAHGAFQQALDVQGVDLIAFKAAD